VCVQAERTSSEPTGANSSLTALQSQLELSNAQLHATVAELESSRQRLRESQLEIDKLKHRIDWLCRKLFGKSSEKVDPSQLALAFEQLAVEDAAAGTADAKAPEEDGPVETDSGEPRGRGKKKGHGRSALPAHLPRRRVVIEVPSEGKRPANHVRRRVTGTSGAGETSESERTAGGSAATRRRRRRRMRRLRERRPSKRRV
jgi:hypothetical protein